MDSSRRQAIYTDYILEIQAIADGLQRTFEGKFYPI